MRGSLTGYIDVAQVTLYAFFIFFFSLVYWLRKEDKREGYPEVVDGRKRGPKHVVGFPFLPKPKVFHLQDGGLVYSPGPREEIAIAAKPVEFWPGSPLQPTGNPMVDAVGPASYAMRRQVPERMLDGSPMIVPLRLAPNNFVNREDLDPRGLPVLGADKVQAGTVSDIWVDKAEPQIRYLEVAVAGAADKTVLLPMTFARVSRTKKVVKVKSILAGQFAAVPGIANPDQITKREEDRIMAYYGSGHLYAKPSRMGPLL